MKNFTIKNQKNSRKGFLFAGFIWLLIWQAGAMIVDNSLLLPSIPDSIRSLIELLGEGSFYLNCLSTIMRTLVSIILSYFLGIGFAWVSYRNDFIERVLSLPVAFFKAVPVMAIIIYFIIIVDSDYVAILVSFLMCFPIVYTNALGGLKNAEVDLLELAQVNKLTVSQTFKYIYLPSMQGNLKSALSLIAGISWKAVIAAEILAIPSHSLGYEMLTSKYYLETSRLFAYIAAVILLSIVMEKAIVVLTQRKRQVVIKDKISDSVSQSCSIKLEKVSKSFNGKKVLDSLSFNLNEGECIGIMDSSGSGKTTLARIIAGLEKVDEGNISVDGEIMLAYLFQEDRLIPWMNVYNNILIGNIGLPNKDKIFEIAKKLEIEDYLEMYPHQLSGGISHRVAIARSLISNSNLIILDEPFRGLDMELKERILSRVWKDIIKEKAVILISHNVEDCNKLCDKIISLMSAKRDIM